MARDRFNYQDAGLVNFDRDGFPHNIGSVGIFEGAIPFDDYLAHVDERLDQVPRYRQRMVRAPLDLAAPVWRDDPHFNLQDHVRPVALAEPGDDRQLAHLAGEFFAQPLDRARPLWQILLVQGLAGGRTAQLVKAHHCLVDGVGGVKLLLALLDTKPEPPRPREGHRAAPEPLPDPAVRLVDAICDRIQDQLEIAESVALTAIRPSTALRWSSSVGRAVWAARPYLSKPAPDTPWSSKLSGPRRLAWQDLPLSQSRAVCAALGGKVNDLVLTVLGGALRKYFLLHDWETEGVVLRVAVPVNARTEGDTPALGNHVSMMLAGLPLDIEEPRERFRAIRSETKRLKAAGQAEGIDNLLRFLGRLAPPIQAALGKRMTAPNVLTNLLCTNVPGPETPLYCMGREMTAHYPWVLLTWRMGLGVAVMSYRNRLWFSFTGDAATLSDIERLPEFLAEEFRNLHDAATTGGADASGTMPETASPPAAAELERVVISGVSKRSGPKAES